MWQIIKAEQSYYKSLYPIALIFHAVILRYIMKPNKWLNPEEPFRFVLKIHSCIIAATIMAAVIMAIYAGVNMEKGTPEYRQRLHILLPVSARSQSVASLLSFPFLIWISLVFFWTGYMALAPHPLDRSIVWTSLAISSLMASGYGFGFAIDNLALRPVVWLERALQLPSGIFRGISPIAALLIIAFLPRIFGLSLKYAFSPTTALALNLISLLPLYIGSTTFTRRKSYLF